MFDINYRPAVLKEVQNTYVEWYARNPETGKFVRFRKHLDRIKSRKHCVSEKKQVVSRKGN